MAFSAATSQATIQTAYEAIRKAELALAEYLRINNPALLTQTDTLIAAAATAIAAVRA